MLRALALLAVLTPLGLAQTAADLGSEISVTLKNGDTVSGTLVESNVYTITLDHPLLGGALTIARTAIAAPGDDEVGAEAADDAAAAEGEPEIGDPWSGSFDAMLSGAGGNSDTEVFRSSLNMRRQTEDTIDTYELTYQMARTDGVKDQDRLFGKARREWELDGSEWRPFLQGTGEVDEFKDWTYRVAAHTGAARTLIEGDEQELTVRVGVGASKEVGADEDEVKPEGLLGASYRKDLNDTSRFTASVDVYPALDDTPQYRAEASAYYESLLSAEAEGNPWTFKTGVSTNYDSTPGPDFRKNDYAYFAGVGVIF